MLIRAVVVGINHWDSLTFPLWKGLVDNNPTMQIVVVDNASDPEYPMKSALKLRERIGYGNALNAGANHGRQDWDWLLCCNNDCLCTGPLDFKALREDTIYGEGWKYDYLGTERGLPAVVDSGYFIIPRKIWDVVGQYDPRCDAAFEEVDYCLRALSKGFRLDILDSIPLKHLNLHTRYEDLSYRERWKKTADYFTEKWKDYHAERLQG